MSDPGKPAKVEEAMRTAVAEADQIACVSRRLASYLVDRFAVAPEKITVVPCCVDAPLFSRAAEERPAVRQELGVGEKFVVAYNGSMQWYQRPDEALRLFETIRSIRRDAHLVVLTPRNEAFDRLCRAHGLSRGLYTVLSLPSSAVPRYLAAADAGLLIREDNVVNRVASPVKAGEYLASGTPVIMSDQIGDLSKLVADENVGLIVPSPVDGKTANNRLAIKAFVDEYLRNTEAWRARSRAVASDQLDWNVHLPRIRDLYHRLAAGPFVSSAVSYEKLTDALPSAGVYRP